MIILHLLQLYSVKSQGVVVVLVYTLAMSIGVKSFQYNCAPNLLDARASRASAWVALSTT